MNFALTLVVLSHAIATDDRALRPTLEWDGRSASLAPLGEIARTCREALKNERLDDSSRFQVFLRLSDARYLEDDISASIEAAEAARKLQPRSVEAEWRIYRGKVKEPNGQVEALKPAIDGILRDHPEFAPAYYLAARYRWAAKDLSGSVKFAELTLEKDSTYTPAVFLLALARFVKGEYQDCLREIDRANGLPALAGLPRVRLRQMQGAAFMKLGKYREAESILSAAVTGTHDDLQFGEALWICLSEQKKDASARLLAEELVRRYPKEATAHAWLARSLVKPGKFGEAEKAAGRGDPLPAVDHAAFLLQAILEWDGRSVNVMSLGDISRGCREALKNESLNDSTRFQVFLRMSDARYLEDDICASTEAAEAARKLQPRSVEAEWRVYRGKVKDPNGQVGALKPAIDGILRDHPEFAPAYYLAACYQFEKNEYRATTTFAKLALEKDPTYTLAAVLLVCSRFMQEEYRDCLQEIDRANGLPALDGRPSVVLRQTQGLALMQLGKYREAEAVFSTAKEITEDLQIAGYVWYCFSNQNKNGSARQIAEELVARFPKEANAHAWLARSLVQDGKFDEAEKAARRGVQETPNSPEAWGALGVVKYCQQDYAQCLTAYYRATQTRIPNPEIGLRAAFLFATCPQAKYRDGKAALGLAVQRVFLS